MPLDRTASSSMSFPAATQPEAFDDTTYRIANGNDMFSRTLMPAGSVHTHGSGNHTSSVYFSLGSDPFNPDVLLYRLRLLRMDSFLEAICGLRGRGATSPFHSQTLLFQSFSRERQVALPMICKGQWERHLRTGFTM